MRVTSLWTSAGERTVPSPSAPVMASAAGDKAFETMLAIIVACNNARLGGASGPEGDPTELALLEIAARAGTALSDDERGRCRERLFHFDPGRKLMSTVDRRDGRLLVDTKGAPEEVLPRCTSAMKPDGTADPLDDEGRRALIDRVEATAAGGLRVLAFAVRDLDANQRTPTGRDDVEKDLCLVGLVGMFDPPRPEVADAVGALSQRRRAHRRHHR